MHDRGHCVLGKREGIEVLDWGWGLLLGVRGGVSVSNPPSFETAHALIDLLCLFCNTTFWSILIDNLIWNVGNANWFGSSCRCPAMGIDVRLYTSWHPSSQCLSEAVKSMLGPLPKFHKHHRAWNPLWGTWFPIESLTHSSLVVLKFSVSLAFAGSGVKWHTLPLSPLHWTSKEFYH